MKFILNEAETFGFETGGVDTAKVFPGGDGGDWGGSMPRALQIGSYARACSGKKNPFSSQKRSRVKTASGNTSDHYKGNLVAYALDIPTSGKAGDELLACIMEKFNNGSNSSYKGGHWLNVNVDGYRYQFGWRVKNHYDHIHVGVKKIGESKTEFKKDEEPGKKTESPVVSGIKKIIFTDFPADQEKIIDGVLKKLESEGLKDNFSKIVLASLVIYNLEESKTIKESTEGGSSNAKGFISKIKEKEFTSLDGALDFFEEEFGVTDFNKPEIKKIAEKFKLEVGTDSGTKKIDMELIKKFIAAFDKKYEKYEVAEEVSNNENLNEELTRIKDIMKKIL